MAYFSEYPLSELLPENHVYGFAIWQLLEPYSDCSCIFNQPKAEDFQPSAPQAVSVRWDHDRGDLPPDWFQYTVMVLIQTDKPFHDQVARLEVISECSVLDGTCYLTEDTYTMPLGRLMQVLPRLRQYANQILPCLECESKEYSIDM